MKFNTLLLTSLLFLGTALSSYPLFAQGNAPAKPETQVVAEKKVNLINLNTADVKALTSLPGIGKTKAKRIIDYREQHGQFQSIEQLANVKGLGKQSIAKLKQHITL